MIASVSGEVLVRRPDYVVIDAAGVGYRLAVSAETLKAVPARGKRASLHAHLVAREDSLSLYGFASEEERDLFLLLIGVALIADGFHFHIPRGYIYFAMAFSAAVEASARACEHWGALD